MEYIENQQQQKEIQLPYQALQTSKDRKTNSDQSLIQDDYAEKKGLWMKILHTLDIFSFLPVPKTQPVSTKQSIVGSLALLMIFLAYVLYSFIMFLINNYPKMTAYITPLSNSLVIPAPRMAIQFLWGQDLNMLFPNQLKYITITFQQVIKDKNGIQYKVTYPLSHDNCGTLDWIGPPYTNPEYNLLCPPNNTDYNMSGLLLTSPAQQYPQFVINYCNSTFDPTCYDGNIQNLYNMTGGGRIFLFIETQQHKNYATGDTIENNYNFLMKYFFLTPGMYNRAELIMQVNYAYVEPDYLTSFSENIVQALTFVNQNNYISNVSYFNPLSAFQIWMRLDQNVENINVVYQTIINQISMWGALWGVLFALFAFFFLRYNQKKFYNVNPKWNKFDQEIDKLNRQSKENIGKETIDSNYKY